MGIAEILKSMLLVVDRDGRPTAALLDIDAWNAVVSMLEDAEDIQLLRERMASWQSKAGWTRWEEFKAELEADAL